MPGISELLDNRMSPILYVQVGGRGSRIGEYTAETPKPMLRFGNRSGLERILDTWVDFGISKIILLVGYKHNKISEYFGNHYRGIEVLYVFDNMLGTGYSFVNALQKSFNMFGNHTAFCVNGDTLLCLDEEKLIGELRKINKSSAILFFLTSSVRNFHNPSESVTVIDAKKLRVIKLSKKNSLDSEKHLSTGVYLIPNIESFIEIVSSFNIKLENSNFENQILKSLLNRQVELSVISDCVTDIIDFGSIENLNYLKSKLEY